MPLTKSGDETLQHNLGLTPFNGTKVFYCPQLSVQARRHNEVALLIPAPHRRELFKSLTDHLN